MEQRLAPSTRTRVDVSAVRDPVGALAYENHELVRRFAREHEITVDAAARRFTTLKQFLVTCAALDVPCSPSRELDELWHQFIIDTRAYETYCHAYLGRFVHHNPTDRPFVASRAAMLDFAQALFREVDLALWPSTEVVACDSSCSGDSYCSGDRARN